MPKLGFTARRGISVILIMLLGTGLTITSLQYKQPANCQSLCMKSPCQVGECQFGEQRAGFPLPFIWDTEQGSPTSSWGKADLDGDLTSLNYKAFVLNILFYSLFLWLVGKIVIFGKRLRWR